MDIFNQKKDMVILDVGAQVGIVTHYMRQFAKKIYAIEPSPEHFEALKKNKEFNGVGIKAHFPVLVSKGKVKNLHIIPPVKLLVLF